MAREIDSKRLDNVVVSQYAAYRKALKQQVGD